MLTTQPSAEEHDDIAKDDDATQGHDTQPSSGDSQSAASKGAGAPWQSQMKQAVQGASFGEGSSLLGARGAGLGPGSPASKAYLLRGGQGGLTANPYARTMAAGGAPTLEKPKKGGSSSSSALENGLHTMAIKEFSKSFPFGGAKINISASTKDLDTKVLAATMGNPQVKLNGLKPQFQASLLKVGLSTGSLTLFGCQFGVSVSFGNISSTVLDAPEFSVATVALASKGKGPGPFLTALNPLVGKYAPFIKSWSISISYSVKAKQLLKMAKSKIARKALRKMIAKGGELKKLNQALGKDKLRRDALKKEIADLKKQRPLHANRTRYKKFDLKRETSKKRVKRELFKIGNKRASIDKSKKKLDTINRKLEKAKAKLRQVESQIQRNKARARKLAKDYTRSTKQYKKAISKSVKLPKSKLFKMASKKIFRKIGTLILRALPVVGVIMTVYEVVQAIKFVRKFLKNWKYFRFGGEGGSIDNAGDGSGINSGSKGDENGTSTVKPEGDRSGDKGDDKGDDKKGSGKGGDNEKGGRSKVGEDPTGKKKHLVKANFRGTVVHGLTLKGLDKASISTDKKTLVLTMKKKASKSEIAHALNRGLHIEVKDGDSFVMFASPSLSSSSPVVIEMKRSEPGKHQGKAAHSGTAEGAKGDEESKDEKKTHAKEDKETPHGKKSSGKTTVTSDVSTAEEGDSSSSPSKAGDKDGGAKSGATAGKGKAAARDKSKGKDDGKSKKKGKGGWTRLDISSDRHIRMLTVFDERLGIGRLGSSYRGKVFRVYNGGKFQYRGKLLSLRLKREDEEGRYFQDYEGVLRVQSLTDGTKYEEHLQLRRRIVKFPSKATRTRLLKKWNPAKSSTYINKGKGETAIFYTSPLEGKRQQLVRARLLRAELDRKRNVYTMSFITVERFSAARQYGIKPGEVFFMTFRFAELTSLTGGQKRALIPAMTLAANSRILRKIGGMVTIRLNHPTVKNASVTLMNAGSPFYSHKAKSWLIPAKIVKGNYGTATLWFDNPLTGGLAPVHVKSLIYIRYSNDDQKRKGGRGNG